MALAEHPRFCPNRLHYMLLSSLFKHGTTTFIIKSYLHPNSMCSHVINSRIPQLVLFSAALSPSHQRNAGTLDIDLQPLLYRRRIYIPLAPLRRQCGIRVAEFKNRKFVSLDCSCFRSLKQHSPSHGPDCLTFTLHRSHSCMSLCPIDGVYSSIRQDTLLSDAVSDSDVMKRGKRSACVHQPRGIAYEALRTGVSPPSGRSRPSVTSANYIRTMRN